MKKKYFVIVAFAAISASSLSFQQANAGELDTTLGTEIKFNTTDAAAREFKFKPSPLVNISGDTSDEAFIVAAAHSKALNKTGGIAYAMASTGSGLYAQDVDALDTLPAVALPNANPTEAEMITALGSYKLEEGTAAAPSKPPAQE